MTNLTNQQKPILLIVDDMPSNIKAMAEIFNTEEYELVVTISGQDALNIVASQHVDLILLDVVMPEMDGYAVCEQLQANPATKEIPIIFVTVKDDPWEEFWGLQIGAVDFIIKPIRRQTVLARVKTHLELKKQRDLLKKFNTQLSELVAERTQELVASRTQLQAIFDTAIDAIITIDQQGRIVLINAAGEKMFGYEADELTGQNVKILMSSPDRENHDLYLQRCVATDKRIFVGTSREVIGRKKDGTLFCLDLGLAGVKLADRDRQLFTGILRDITQRKQVEESAMRTARLASLGTLTAGIAHEINNPNNAIGFAAATITRLWHDFVPFLDEYRELSGDFTVCGLPMAEGIETISAMVKTIGENTQRIAAIIANLKHMVKGEGEIVPNQVVDINKTLHYAIALLQNLIHTRTSHFTMQLADDLPPMRGNAQQLEQVFINLIQNALHALPNQDRGVSVVTAIDQWQGQPSVAVSVRDEGIGMQQEQLQLITKPFYTTRGEQGGTGLGLSIANTIVAHHHGHLTFASQPGVGTTATVFLPIPTDSVEDASHDL